VGKLLIKCLPWAAVFRLGVACWVYGNSTIFPPGSGDDDDDDDDDDFIITFFFLTFLYFFMFYFVEKSILFS
jgi:hypothetical protein